MLIGGPTILQKFYQEGVPLRIFGTAFTLSDLLIFARDDKIKSFADLKGKQLAADMGGSQFQVIKIYANAKGIELGKDITVVNANFAVARAQLEADRVEAALRHRAARQHHFAAESNLEGHLQRCAGLAGNHRPGWLGAGAGNPRRRHPARAERPQDAARRPAGRGERHAQRDRRERTRSRPRRSSCRPASSRPRSTASGST